MHSTKILQTTILYSLNLHSAKNPSNNLPKRSSQHEINIPAAIRSTTRIIHLPKKTRRSSTRKIAYTPDNAERTRRVNEKPIAERTGRDENRVKNRAREREREDASATDGQGEGIFPNNKPAGISGRSSIYQMRTTTAVQQRNTARQVCARPCDLVTPRDLGRVKI